MVAGLTQRDVSRLLAEPSPDVRAEIAEKVSATLSEATIAPEEIALAQDIVRILARDVEVRVRASVAQNLRHARSLLQEDGPVARVLPPVALVTSRHHLARCQLLAQRLGFRSVPVAAEARLVLNRRYVVRLLAESGYLMWIDIGMRWARLIGHRRIRTGR